MTRNTKNLLKGLAFISPWLIGLLAFQLYPAFASVYYSFCSYNILQPPAFIGLENYQNLVHDRIFMQSLGNTIVYTALTLPLSLAISLFFAMLLNQQIAGRGIFRTLYFLPSLVPVVALAILWKWMLNGQYGILNHLLGLLHIPGPNWLGSTAWGTPAIVLSGLWGIGGSIVIYLAALQDVPRDLYQAAEIDGANWWHKARHITIPMISPVIYFNLILGVIGCMQVFAVPYVMTSGGPARATYYYTMYLFDSAFEFLKMGYASAMALILFAIILLLTLLTSKITSRKVHYADK